MSRTGVLTLGVLAILTGLWRGVFAAGPPVENGFYYDLDLSHRISPEDFPKIEEEMKKEIKANNTFEKIAVAREQALKDAQSGRLGGLSERPGNPSKFNTGKIKIRDANNAAPNGRLLDLLTFPLRRRYQYLPNNR